MSNPMRFFDREYEPLWLASRQATAAFVGCDAQDLVLVENATYAMNVIADSLDLPAGSVVTLTDHEYGAVRRIFERRARERDWKLATIQIPLPLESEEQFADSLFAQLPDHCRAVVLSHVTSATAIRFPLETVREELKRRNVLLIVDGPHAPAQIPLDLSALRPDYYAASCHKWLSAPLGTGFLYIDREHQATVRPPLLSWGRLLPGVPERWDEEFLWSGTRNLVPDLCLPLAIDLMTSLGLDAFRERTRSLAGAVREILARRWGVPPISPWTPDWQLSMSLAPLPPGRAYPQLKRTLAERYGVEAPVVEFAGRWYLRVSCHWYTTAADLRKLLAALDALGL
ncbi:MAG TPA: aminotransferase class V-fold PLP-dependent enzyme [Pirellulaceae bacterium]|jgi:isopenicillin-N epimerase|nr:aminotransferase class V-fold PLP-dependent enzyme [Pirellulaceae bacterium]